MTKPRARQKDKFCLDPDCFSLVASRRNKYCSKECLGAAMQGRARGDLSRTSVKKYVRVRRGGKLIYLHRYVMAQHLGRDLTEKEVVHHNDENPRNNDLSNLTLFASQAEHLDFHRRNPPPAIESEEFSFWMQHSCPASRAAQT